MIEAPKIDEHGLQYYEHVPEGFRLATEKDLKNGLFMNNTGFLVHAYHTRVFYPHRVKIAFPESMLPFLKDGRIFIYMENEK